MKTLATTSMRCKNNEICTGSIIQESNGVIFYRDNVREITYDAEDRERVKALLLSEARKIAEDNGWTISSVWGEI